MSLQITKLSASPAWADPLSWPVDPAIARRRLAKASGRASTAQTLGDLLPHLSGARQERCHELIRPELWLRLTLNDGDEVTLSRRGFLRLSRARSAFHLEAIEHFSAQVQGQHLVVFVKAYKEQDSFTAVYDAAVRRWILASADPIDGLLYLPGRKQFLAYWEYADYGCSHSGLVLYSRGHRVGQPRYLSFRRLYELPHSPPQPRPARREGSLPQIALCSSPMNQSLFPNSALCYSAQRRRIYVVRDRSIRSVALTALLPAGRPVRRS